ncbi:MAG: anthranilate synthase component I [Endomicrobia bacterium]|nr:anthranilate synthase component I [Endomicrobiia bacterium]MCL2506927.1 anthranilate synthase component I [Endomicrobiia bacterium]
MFNIQLKDVKKFAKSYGVVPLSMELFSDVRTPIQILNLLKSNSKKVYMLESVESSAAWGRYTFLGFDPSLYVYGTDSKITVVDEKIKTVKENPSEFLKKLIASYKSPRFDYLPPFTGGLVGYFAYDYVKYAEPSLKLKAKNPAEFMDFYLMLFDKVIAFDHFRQKLVLIANIKTNDIENNYKKAVNDLKEIKKLILSSNIKLSNMEESKTPALDFKQVFSKEKYCKMVEKAKHYIAEGDIFQVVLSNRLEADFNGDFLTVYRNLRTINPSPYMFYIDFGGFQLAGASPETLVSLKNGIVSTYPLAGTTKRGKTKQEDNAFVKSLLENEKELSEHNQLVDLGRNDLGKISEFGSVKVEEYLTIKQLSHVSHIASKVTGKLKAGLTPLDALDASLPAGTLSGAPKKRACEIIDELENLKRGPYGGAVGYIDFTGNMDLCIGIRMAVKKDGKVFVQAGAGVVADSVPEKEYQECLNKAQAMVEAIKITSTQEAI